MKTIKYFPFLVFIFFIFSAEAQTVKIKKGEKSYEIYSYDECIEKFEGLSDKSVDIKRKLAESYFKTGDYENAEKYYAEVALSDEYNSEDVYNYASVLKINRKYDEYKKQMDRFYEMEKQDRRAELFAENKSFLDELLQDNEQFKIKNLDINTSAQDFGTAYYGTEQTVFASTRTATKLFKRVWNWNKLPFLDLYIADIKRSNLDNVKQFKKKFNKKYHEGPASFNKKGDFMAYTLNNYENKSKDGVIKLQIFTSENIDGDWQDPVSLPFNSSEYSVGHPALTEDGKTMYFASDMPGGYGGTDIYVTRKDENGNWSDPENLGETVNTEGNEMFPFIHKNGMLFFASDGLPGIGGLDVFMTKKEGNDFIKPKNLGVPVNSNYDDFALIIDENMKSGFFSSNRTDGKGNDDIYSFKVLKEIQFNKIIKGKTKDTEGQILANTTVILFDQEGNPVKTVESDENGNFEFSAEPAALYTLEGSKPSYISVKEDVDTKTPEDVITKDLILEKMPDFIIHGLVSDSDTKKPLENVKITVTENNTGKTSELNIVDAGDFYLKLPEKHLYDTVNYTFLFEKEGYAPKTFNYNKVLDKYGEYGFNVYMNKIKPGEDLGKLIEINPIYFDFDKYNIRPDAAA
ncbi:MAG: hypothetical protein GXO50_00765, partial [Chlorobi bacterium]|nr:hypothetical protein [Chlorobiota bacterium]